jgi:hypothetical protein
MPTIIHQIRDAISTFTMTHGKPPASIYLGAQVFRQLEEEVSQHVMLRNRRPLDGLRLEVMGVPIYEVNNDPSHIKCG